MRTDLFGSPVALTDAASLTAWNGTMRGFLGHSAVTPTHLGALLQAEPGFALGHGVKGLFCVLLGRREMMQTGADALAEAQRLQAQGASDPRTDAILTALKAMLGRKPGAAIAALEARMAQDPGDTLAMKLSHAIRFLIGDAAGMRASIEAVLPAHGGDHAARGYILGCHAFALEETGDYEAAERTGRAGLIHAPDDAWGLHAVAHVHDMTHRPETGIELIESHQSAWDHCNNFRYHVWWHKALLHLDRGEIDTVLALYDQKIRAEQTDDYRDIANGTSLLMRLELEDVDLGDRWEELAALAENRTEDGCLVFADLHYMLALIGGDRAEAQQRLSTQIAARAQESNELAPIARHPGQAAAQALAAFGEGQYDQAFAGLEQALHGFETIGGSHAQRDVFVRMAVDAGLRAGHLDRTEALLRQRSAGRGGHLDHFATSRMERISAARHLALSVPAQ